MKDPIDPTNDGYILDVKRLRILINDPSLDEDMDVLFSMDNDVEDSTNVFMSRLELVRVKNEPVDSLVITLGIEVFDMWGDQND